MSTKGSAICFLCDSNSSSSYHRFPKHPVLRSQWMEICHLPAGEDVHNLRICGNHFSIEDMYTVYSGKVFLKSGVLPSANLDCSYLLPRYDPFQESRSLSVVPKTCMVLCCENEGFIPGVKYFCMTRARHDAWMRALGRNPAVERLSDKNLICSKHFSSDDLYTNGKGIRLKPNAVPKLFLRKNNKERTAEVKTTDRPLDSCPNTAGEQNDFTAESFLLIQGDVKTLVQHAFPTLKNSSGLLNSPRDNVNAVPIKKSGRTTTAISKFTPTSINESTHYIGEDAIKTFDSCCACMQPLSNDLHSAPVTMVCYDDKTVKDSLQLFLVPHLNQADDDSDKVAITDDDFVCDSCLIVLRNAMKFVKKCLGAREKLQEHFRKQEDSAKVTEVQNNVVVTDIAPDTNHCSVLPLRYSAVPEHDRAVSFKEAVPELLLSLQKSGVALLQNCKSFEDFYDNKRVLLLGNEAFVHCPVCDEQFVSEETMLEHFSAAHNLTKAHLLQPIHYEYQPDESKKCPGCDKVFSSAKYKNNHLGKCRVFVCPYCDATLNWSKLAEHTRREHGDPSPFKCYKCRLEQPNYYSLRSHICNGRRCDDCGRTYFHENRYAVHKKKFCRLKTCRECKKKISISIYEKHMEMHNVPCPKCGKVFRSRVSLRKHMNRHKMKLCPICGKVCKVLKSHMLTHNDNRIKNIACSQCPKRFYRLNDLKLHVRKAHESEQIMCEICGDQVKDYYMKTHMLKHSIKEYKCDTCSESFKNQRCFKLHVRTHTGALVVRKNLTPKTKKYDFRKNDPVYCKHCLKSFKNSIYLQIHMKTHTKSCRVRCRFCSNTYANVKCRSNHEIQCHRGLNDKRRRKVLPGFKKSNICTCEVCGELFQDIDQLDYHLEEEHKVANGSSPVVSELAKEVLLGFQAMDGDEALFFREEDVAADNVEIIFSHDIDS